jgi:hypothetical protein
MNMNEVLANPASEILGGERGENRLVHPNDHVNRGQSSNDVLPTAMSVAAVAELRTRLLPSLRRVSEALAHKATPFARWSRFAAPTCKTPCPPCWAGNSRSTRHRSTKASTTSRPRCSGPYGNGGTEHALLMKTAASDRVDGASGQYRSGALWQAVPIPSR